MSEIARVRDREGRVHHAARESKFVQDGLSNGSLVDIDKEAADATTDAKNGDDLNTRSADGGSGDRERAAGNPDDSDSEGVAKPKTRR